MAIEKVDVLIVGKGDQTSNTTSAHVFTSNNVVATWDSGTSYSTGNCVEYLGNAYRSLANSNLNNTPSTSPSQWEVVYLGVKDGDFALQVAGANSDLLIRKNAVWVSLLNAQLTASIPANTSNFVWLTIPLTVGRFGFMNYSTTRGTSYRSGTANVASDGTVGPTGAGFMEFGVQEFGTPGIVFSAQVTGTNIELLATTDNSDANPTILKYTIKEWS